MISYKDSGVNKEEGYKTVSKIKKSVQSTHNAHVLNELGSFGAFYELKNYKNPVLVSGADGVGTKLRIAFNVKKYDTIGIDCFAMCANDILCHGAKPLFFLDYLACGKLDSDVAAEIIEGIVTACKKTTCALIGGETAEMPGIYQLGDYDIAGFCVGVVEKKEIIDGSRIQEGDVLLGLASSGFHSNGFSLIREVFTNIHEVFEGKPLHEHLLTPTKLYHQPIFDLLKTHEILGIAHITGGGLPENVPRVLHDGLGVRIESEKIPIPSIMRELRVRGGISKEEMFGTFNMGIGMVCVVRGEEVRTIQKKFKESNQEIFQIGHVVKSNQVFELV